MPIALHGQTNSATLSGAIVDPTGARIPGATLTLRNSATHDIRHAKSTDEGLYSFVAVQPGTYTLLIVREGFSSTQQTGIELHPTDDRTINVTLKIGTAKTEVVVNDAETTPDTGEKSSLISATDIQHLSVQGRDVSELAKTQAGFAIVPGAGLTNGSYDPGQVSVGGGLSNFSANGAPSTGISITSDGADITDPTSGNSTTQNINQEMVEEVKIQTSAFGADQAKGPIVLNVQGKQGGSVYHGAIYTYFRTHQLNSGNWFSKNQGIQDANDRYLYPGANVGGPVKLPFLHLNGPRQPKFFVGGEDYVQRNIYAYGNALNSTILALVPTANMRAGNFSQNELANYLGTDVATMNAQCVPNGSMSSYIHLCGQPSGTTNTNLQVPSTGPNAGIIPTGGMDPGASALLNALPLPNRPTIGGFNYTTTNLQNNDLWQIRGRIDETFSDKSRFYITYNAERGRNTGIPETQYYSPANGGPSMGGINTPGKMVARVFTQSLSINHTYIASPTMTNEFYVSAALNRNDFGSQHPELLLASNVGYNYSGIYPLATKQYPQLGDYGYDGLPIALFPDFSAGPMFQHTFTPTGGDNLTKTWRSHTIKLGVYVQRASSNVSSPTPQTNGMVTQYYLPNGAKITNPDNSTSNTLVVNPLYASSDPRCNTTPAAAQCTGNANYLADFAIGDVTQFFQQNFETNLNLYFWNVDFFANDSWKTTRRLTINYGIRFDHLGPWQDSHGNGIAIFSPSLYTNPSNQLLPGLSWHGVDASVPNSGTPGRLFFYSPRVGIAYDLYGNGSTVIRGGFGLYRSHDSGSDYAQAAGTAQGMFISTTGGAGIHLSKLQQGVTSLADCVNPTISNTTSKCPSLNATVYGVDHNDDQQPLTYTYNFTVTQRAYKGSIFEIGYTGSQSHNLLIEGTLQNVNALPVGALFQPDPILHTFQLPNSLSIAQQGNYRPYRPYLAVDVPRHISYSNYNALQTSWNRSRGSLRYGMNYTWSKSLGIRTISGQPGDPTYLRNNYGPLNSDRSQIFNATYAYQFGDHVHGRLGLLANGWEISGITGLQSGPNLQAIYSFNFKMKGAVGAYNVNSISFLGTPEVNLQPLLTCDPSANLKSKQYVNGACFALPNVGGPNGQFNEPYIHGPAYFSSDLTVLKNFKMGEARSVQLRFAAFNFLNHPITSFSGRFPNESNLYFTGNTTATATLPATSGNCSVVGSTCFGYAGYKQGRRVVEVAAKYTF
ncbi:MAG: carboxypeptidase regulatory-like domain-containing protein [Acidobacteriaceae bacterium]|nr:carboxypeptidase regulatory-like domain-containing protein [Acidobacteriaceae bacterium]